MQVPEHQKHMPPKKGRCDTKQWHQTVQNVFLACQNTPGLATLSIPHQESPPAPEFITQLPDKSSISENHSNQANYSKTKCEMEEKQFTQHEDQDTEDDAPWQYMILCDHVLQLVQAGHSGHVGVVPGVAEQQCSSEHGCCGV